MHNFAPHNWQLVFALSENIFVVFATIVFLETFDEVWTLDHMGTLASWCEPIWQSSRDVGFFSAQHCRNVKGIFFSCIRNSSHWFYFTRLWHQQFGAGRHGKIAWFNQYKRIIKYVIIFSPKVQRCMLCPQLWKQNRSR